MFKEGEWHNFFVEKLIEIPGNGHHFVLRHETGRKLLLPAQYYVKYNIAIGSILKCRIDKVNCTGQIFLEPEHPVYRINRIYSFKVIAVEASPIPKTESVVVQDAFGNPISLLAPVGTAISGDALALNVSAIKKGIPVLTLPNGWSECNGQYLQGQQLVMYLRSKFLLNNEEFYFLESDDGCISLLKVKHYRHFRFESSREIRVSFVARNADGTIRVDPVHPLYEVSKEYLFTIRGIEVQQDEQGKFINVAAVYDAFGMKCGFYLDGDKYKVGDEVSCIVTGYRKGRPLLKIVPQKQ